VVEAIEFTIIEILISICYNRGMPLSKLAIVVLTLALFITAALSGSHLIMMTDGQGNMVPCPFMNVSGYLCNMNVIQHMSAWQSLFAATMPAADLIFLVFLALTLLSETASSKNSRLNYLEETSFLAFKNRDSDSFSSDRLRLAFSRGILHSKRYHRVSIF
jgi:hypothetical protein